MSHIDVLTAAGVKALSLIPMFLRTLPTGCAIKITAEPQDSRDGSLTLEGTLNRSTYAGPHLDVDGAQWFLVDITYEGIRYLGAHSSTTRGGIAVQYTVVSVEAV